MRLATHGWPHKTGHTRLAAREATRQTRHWPQVQPSRLPHVRLHQSDRLKRRRERSGRKLAHDARVKDVVGGAQQERRDAGESGARLEKRAREAASVALAEIDELEVQLRGDHLRSVACGTEEGEPVRSVACGTRMLR